MCVGWTQYRPIQNACVCDRVLHLFKSLFHLLSAKRKIC
uniref:Uncharacterized protein n=1 Tax=Anguilla anguilla TaxID=7936 RepID=A0A0E9QWF5_ANGAN